MTQSQLEKDDYSLLFSTPRGQRVLQDLARWIPSLFEPTKVTHAIDPIGMGIEIGRCDVVKRIYKKMKVDPFKEQQKYATKGM